MNESDDQGRSAFLEPLNSVTSDSLNEKMPTIQTLHSNTNLLNRANQMEEALTECQKSLQSYRERLYSAESTLTQQAQELAAAQEQVRCLLQELEACHQKVQHQQILTESYGAQLQSSQERIAQLERECSFTQSNYNQQSHQLMQTENACQELRIRLNRQQSYTLQFKLALEKTLDTSVLSYQAQPIQAWPAQPQPLTDELPDVAPPPSLVIQSPELISNLPEIHEVRGGPLLEDAAQEEHLQNLVNMLETEAESVATVTHSSNDSPPVQTDDDNLLVDTSSEPVLPDYTAQRSASFFNPDSNWPSPVVHPSRPPRGRKSLAAIELPTFAQDTLHS